MTDHRTRDIDRLETRNKSWAPGDLLNARIRRQKGNHLGYAGYRQRGRAEARIAKRVRARNERRLGKLFCEDPDV